jgi:hypothetical protein
MERCERGKAMTEKRIKRICKTFKRSDGSTKMYAFTTDNKLMSVVFDKNNNIFEIDVEAKVVHLGKLHD